MSSTVQNPLSAWENSRGNQEDFFADAEANNSFVTVDGIRYLVDRKNNWYEIAKQWTDNEVILLTEEEKADLIKKYTQQTNGETKNTAAEQLVDSITNNHWIFPSALRDYFAKNPITPSQEKQLIQKDINNIDAYLTNEMYVDWYKWMTRQELVAAYLSHIFAKAQKEERTQERDDENILIPMEEVNPVEEVIPMEEVNPEAEAVSMEEVIPMEEVTPPVSESDWEQVSQISDNEYKEMKEYDDELWRKIKALESELWSDRLQYNELMRRPKEEKLLALKKKREKHLARMDEWQKSHQKTHQNTHEENQSSSIMPDGVLQANENNIENNIENNPQKDSERNSNEPSRPRDLPVISKELVISAVLSNTESIHYERIAKEVEEQLEKEYDELGKRNILKKMKFFLTRKKMRKERIEALMQKIGNKPFLDDKEYNAYLGDVVERHQVEQWHNDTDYNTNTVTKVAQDVLNDDNKKELNKRATEYILWTIDDAKFTQHCNTIIESDADVKTILKDANINLVATNILYKLQEQKAMHTCVKQIESAYNTYLQWKSHALDSIDSIINTFFDTYQNLPLWMDHIVELKNNIYWATDNASKKDFEKNLALSLISIETSLQMQARSIKIALDVLTWWKDAQHVDNADHTKTLYHIGEAYEQLPWRAKVGGTLLAGTFWGMLASWTAVAFAVPWLFVWSVVWVKKYIDYTKEHKTQEKMSVVEHKKFMEKRDALMTIKGWKSTLASYRANRQLELYHNTMQETVSSVQETQQNLRNAYKKYRKDPIQENESLLRNQLIESLVSLDIHASLGHPVLYADSLYEAEKTMVGLKKSLYYIQKQLDENSWLLHTALRETEDYKNRYDELHQKYQQTSDAFKKARTVLGVKYGVVMWTLASWLSWWFSEWLNALNQKFGWFTEATDATSFTAGSQETSTPINHDTSFDTNPEDKYDLAQNFTLWWHESNPWSSELADNLYQSIQNSVSDWQVTNITINYGAGTDWIPVAEGTQMFTDAVYQEKLQTVFSKINDMTWLSTEHKEMFLQELNKQPWNASISNEVSFTNDALFKMRCLEIEQVAEAINNLWDKAHWITLELVHDNTLNIAWTAWDNAAERVFWINLELTQVTPWTEGTTQVTTTYLPVIQDMPVATPLFANTFATPPQEENPIASTP
jgi:hypothetical protein